jgi:hypothetical protein
MPKPAKRETIQRNYHLAMKYLDNGQMYNMQLEGLNHAKDKIWKNTRISSTKLQNFYTKLGTQQNKLIRGINRAQKYGLNHYLTYVKQNYPKSKDKLKQAEKWYLDEILKEYR